ncbi:TIMELESS-interacting protein [Rhineura floridana]|uniref:TIMELESS-interacting protein n=1 Tax=Rhineura floridana TaxID=261503 RepID=UPI002AC84247|nr:TIMELESS-interacting protein [Rhineura floridana]XP_061451114.1 TIMELESS-interacting protein [Rhineura floridana]
MIDPIEGNLFDLPDYEQIQDETFLPLPPPDSPGDLEGNLVNGEPEGNKLSQTKDSSVTTRKAVKRPVPKLDAQRLASERGLPALRNMFDNVKFKGKGCEEADLKALVRHMEHWAHRLFPKLQFEDFVERVESLGNKKPVQACLKRIRLDLPILHEDFTSNEGEDGGSSRPSTATEELDLFSENQNAREEFGLPQSTVLTEEQQQRIERNRQLALGRRQAKMQFSSQPQEDELPVTQPNEECDPIAADLPTVEAGSISFLTIEKMESGNVEEDKRP